MLSASVNLFECHEEVLYLQPLILPKRFDISPPITGGCSEGLGVLRFFFKIEANSLEHKERYDIITDEEWYIFVKV